MATIDTRDKWSVINTTTGATVQTCHSRETAERVTATFNRHEQENGRGIAYSVTLNRKCEAFRELLRIAQEKGVDLSTLFTPVA